MATPWWKLSLTVDQLRLDLTVRAGGPVTPDEHAEAAWTRLMLLLQEAA